ncbi:splicing factor 3B subunit 5/RDS3 complex subunit 10 [Lipomyces japonicus]|uniref:splicing factor 3B subunit 5/RDS3 complex subunit 10 n=1 Tax=Lipomyces japonicus TaxID=56871 RepID=UPI0034CE1219
MADKLRVQQQLEQLQTRYVGVGHADTTKHEWLSNIRRDSYASYIGHPPLLEYYAVALNEPQVKIATEFIEKMVLPCGPPKEKEFEE